jgi:tetratricopeptide (TPR) repeat protein
VSTPETPSSTRAAAPLITARQSAPTSIAAAAAQGLGALTELLQQKSEHDAQTEERRLAKAEALRQAEDIERQIKEENERKWKARVAAASASPETSPDTAAAMEVFWNRRDWEHYYQYYRDDVEAHGLSDSDKPLFAEAMLLAGKDTARAIQLILDAADHSDIDDERTGLLTQAGYYLTTIGKWSEARNVLKRAIHDDSRPLVAGAYNNLGYIEAETGNPKQAINYFEKAAHIRAKESEAATVEEYLYHYNVAVLNMRLGDKKKALSEFGTAERLADRSFFAPADTSAISRATQQIAWAILKPTRGLSKPAQPGCYAGLVDAARRGASFPLRLQWPGKIGSRDVPPPACRQPAVHR